MIFLGKELEPFHDPFIVAEISCNHGGNISEALELINVAKQCGANAVKIQSYTPDEMTIASTNEDFVIKDGLWKGQTLYELYTKTYTPLWWLPELFDHAKVINIPIFSSVFGKASFEALEKVNCPAYKIASFEACDTNLIKMVSSAKKPIVISLGAVTRDEIKRIAFNYVNIIPMHCISKYPAKFNELELAKIYDHRRMFDDPVGFSDHTICAHASQMAITMGACILEKHLTISKTTEDAAFSLDPYEFKRYVESCRAIIKGLTIKEENIDKSFRRSLYAVEDVYKGEIFTEKNIRSIRPGYGLEPYKLNDVLDKKATSTIRAGTALKQEHIDNDK